MAGLPAPRLVSCGACLPNSREWWVKDISPKSLKVLEQEPLGMLSFLGLCFRVVTGLSWPLPSKTQQIPWGTQNRARGFLVRWEKFWATYRMEIPVRSSAPYCGWKHNMELREKRDSSKSPNRHSSWHWNGKWRDRTLESWKGYEDGKCRLLLGMWEKKYFGGAPVSESFIRVMIQWNGASSLY